MKYYQQSALDVVFKITLLILAFFCFHTVSVSAQSYDDHTMRAKYAGLYVSIPFGQKVKEQSKVKFGIAAGLRHDQFSEQFDQTGKKVFHSRLLDLQFNEQGFKTISFTGRNLMQRDTSGGLVYLDGEDGEGMSLGGKILIGVGALMAVTTGVAYVALKNVGDDPCDEGSC